MSRFFDATAPQAPRQIREQLRLDHGSAVPAAALGTGLLLGAGHESLDHPAQRGLVGFLKRGRRLEGQGQGGASGLAGLSEDELVGHDRKGLGQLAKHPHPGFRQPRLVAIEHRHVHAGGIGQLLLGERAAPAGYLEGFGEFHGHTVTGSCHYR